MTKNERQVALGGTSEQHAKDAVAPSNMKEIWDAGSLPSAIPEFTKFTCGSFKAEWTVLGDDLHFHFYLPKHAVLTTPEARASWMEYWLKRFSAKLDVEARAYFEAEAPRLVVKYTDEEASWWFKAQGYSHILVMKDFVTKFLEQLDASLQQKVGS